MSISLSCEVAEHNLTFNFYTNGGTVERTDIEVHRVADNSIDVVLFYDKKGIFRDQTWHLVNVYAPWDGWLYRVKMDQHLDVNREEAALWFRFWVPCAACGEKMVVNDGVATCECGHVLPVEMPEPFQDRRERSRSPGWSTT